MIIPDVNVLLYAHVDAFPPHPAVRAWWERTLAEDEVGIPSVSAFGFLRVATNRRIFEVPLEVHAASAIVRFWLERPNVRLLTGGPRHLELALGFLDELGTAANLTTDAQIAAHAIEQRGIVATNDTDFARFPGVRCVNPCG